ncbi:MAG: hypothetical protein EA350_16440 [Gemmatimonadales bacterium]|nr:MAG: hypothetical protein EA350_16440 [Gemmatimonadales bacterium]
MIMTTRQRGLEERGAVWPGASRGACRWRRRRAGLGLAGLLLLAGCASTEGAAPTQSWDLGLATPGDAAQKSTEVLRNYRFEVERSEGPPNIFILTRWQQRTPLEDEAALGAVLAQTRFIVEARARRRNPQGEDLFTVRLRVENQLRLDGAMSDWVEQPHTSDFRAFAAEIAAEIRASLQSGIRVTGPG